MAKRVINNEVKTTFTSSGAEKVTKQTETVGRNQTRMAQASASASRSFAAQASGLGGLVGVYAAAAANVFAITAAFEALGRAAQAEQIIRGTKTLAIEIGAAGATILRSVQEITQGQLTLAESAQNINIALSAGFNTSQIEALSEISLKASRALGRNLTDAFQRVVRGAAKLEPELLDELGIFTRIDPAVEAYANKLGVAASSLTNFEKRQAFVNAVIDEGQKKFGSIDTSIDTTQKKFEKLRVQLVELATEFGQLTAAVLGPLVDFLNNNLGAALLLFGGILSLVFGRAVAAIGGFVANSIRRLGDLADFIADKAKFPLERITALQKAISQPIGQGGLSGIRAAPVIGQDPAQAARFKEALDAQRTGAVTTASQLNKVNRAYKEQIAFIKTTGRTGTKSFAALTSAVAANSAALATGGTRVLAFTAASNLLTIAVRGAAFAFGLLASAVNFLFIGLAVAQLVGTLFDVDLLAKIKGLFVDLSKASAELKAGLAGAVEASGRESIADFLLRIGESKEVLEDIPDLIKDINTELRNFRGTQTAEANALAIAAGEIQKIGTGGLTATAITNQFKDLPLLKQREFRLKALLSLTEKNDADNLVRIELLERLIDANNRFGQSETLLAGAAEFLGLSTAEVLRLTEDSISVNKELDRTFIRFLPNVNLLGKRFSDLKKEEQDVITSGTLLLKVFEDSEKSFNRGAASAETLSKKIFGLRQAIDDVKSKGGVVSKQDEDRLKRLVKQQKELKELEIIGKALVDTYGKYGQTLDKAVQEGLVADGKIAETAEEQAKNQAKFLADQAGILSGSKKQLEVAKAQGIEEEKRNANQVQLLINAERARKDILGLAFSTLQTIEKEIIARQRVEKQLEAQLKLLKAQQNLQQLRANQALEQERFSQRVNLAQQELDVRAKGFELVKLQGEEAQRQNDQLVRELNSQLDLLRRIQGVRASIATGAANRQQRSRQAGIRAAQGRLQELEAFPNLAGQQAILAARKEIADLVLENELAGLKERERVAAQEANDQLALLAKRLEINSTETENIQKAISREESSKTAELSLLKDRQRVEALRANAESFQIQARRDIAAQERIIAQLNIKAQEDKFKQDNLQFQRQIEGIKAQAEVINTLVAILNDDNNAFVKAVEALTDGPIDFKATVGEVNTKFAGLENLQKDIENLQGSIIATTTEAADRALNSSMALFDAQDKGLSDQREGQRDLAKLEKDRITREADNKIKALNDERNLLREKARLLGTEITQIEQAYARRIEQINKDRDAAIDANKKVADENKRANDVVRKALDQISDTVNSSFVSGFQELNDAFIEGTLTIDNLKRGFRDFAAALVRDIQRIFFTETIAKPAAEFLTESLGLSGEQNATGGAVVKMASGGMLRDRVPALLEPGEFVIRKPMAKAIGGPALNAMNATGTMPGNVSINIQNDGTPKDAQASQPRFDGEKFVVDIVMRDLRNNGPIRKSLRAGG